MQILFNLIANSVLKPYNIVALSDIHYQNLPERFASIDYRSEEGELIQFILEIIGNGETDPQKIVKK